MFSYDGPVYRFLKKVSDVTVMNLLWLLTSLQIVTLGASTTALYATTLARRQGDDRAVTTLSFCAFRRRWKQATVLFLAILAAAVVLLSNLYFSNYVADGILAEVFAVVSLALWVPLALLAMYGFAVVALEQTALVPTVKRALLAAYAHPLCSIKLAICWAALIVFNLSSMYANVMTLCIGVGVFVHVCLSRTLLTALLGKNVQQA